LFSFAIIVITKKRVVVFVIRPSLSVCGLFDPPPEQSPIIKEYIDSIFNREREREREREKKKIELLDSLLGRIFGPLIFDVPLIDVVCRDVRCHLDVAVTMSSESVMVGEMFPHVFLCKNRNNDMCERDF